MLIQIDCIHFSSGPLRFREGLNAIIGDDRGKNSIGKSTALMIIDFAFGGETYLTQNAGAISILGEQTYSFCFKFQGKFFYFRRSTSEPTFVDICDEKYNSTNRITIELYTTSLKEFYKLETEGSFRSIVSPFCRIWKKGNHDSDHPFSGHGKESQQKSISRLMDMFAQLSRIEELSSALQDIAKEKGVLNKSMQLDIIPKIGVVAYRKNEKLISSNQSELANIKSGFSNALSAYEAIFSEALQELGAKRQSLLSEASELSARINRLNRDINGVKTPLPANIKLITEFFPQANVTRMVQIEKFHKKIGKILQGEIESAIEIDQARLNSVRTDLSVLDLHIEGILRAKGTPQDIFTRVLDIKSETDRATRENEYYDRKLAIAEQFKTAKDTLFEMQQNLLEEIAGKINIELEKSNSIVYGQDRKPPLLSFPTPNKYIFESHHDTGTGKSYFNLIAFDLAMLDLTGLPFCIHDSILFKNIEIAAMEKLLHLMDMFYTKQIFISIDEVAKFDSDTQLTLFRNMSAKLDENNLLFNKDWRRKGKG